MDYKASLTVKRTVIYILMIFFVLVALIPIYLMLINATRSNAQINAGISLIPGGNALKNWKILTSRSFKISRGFLNSSIVSIGSTVLCCYFSTLTSYALHVYRFKGRAFIWAFIMFVMMLPASLSFIGFYQFMAAIHLTNSFIPLIIPAIASANTVLFIRQYMASVLSLELIDRKSVV